MHLNLSFKKWQPFVSNLCVKMTAARFCLLANKLLRQQIGVNYSSILNLISKGPTNIMVQTCFFTALTTKYAQFSIILLVGWCCIEKISSTNFNHKHKFICVLEIFNILENCYLDFIEWCSHIYPLLNSVLITVMMAMAPFQYKEHLLWCRIFICIIWSTHLKYKTDEA